MEELIRIKKLHGGYFSKKEIVRGISFSAHRGESIGIIGPNGSGKTTLLRLMSRVLPPSNGEIFLEENNIQGMDLKTFSRKIAFVSQDINITFPFSVLDIVLMGRIPHLARMQKESAQDLEITMEAMRLTDTLSLKDKLIDELSAGERQRVIIARALAQQPALIMLDEPTAHLDIMHQVHILGLLRKLNKENNLAIIMVIHDLNLASEYCDRIILLDNGRIFKEGTPQEVLTYQTIESVYKTVVVVHTNPLNQKPYVLLVPKKRS